MLRNIQVYCSSAS